MGISSSSTIADISAGAAAALASADGNFVAVVSKSGNIKIYATDGPDCGNCVGELEGHENGCNCVQFSDDNVKLATCGNDRRVKVWDLLSGELLMAGTHRNRVQYVSFDGLGERIVSRSLDGTLIIWNVSTGSQLQHFSIPCRNLVPVFFSAEGDRIFTPILSSDNSNQYGQDIGVWSVQHEEIVVRLKHHKKYIVSVVRCPTSNLIASCDDGSICCLWNLDTETPLHVISYTRLINVSMTNDGKKIMVASYDKKVSIWDTETASLLKEHGQIPSLGWAVISPYGNHFACGSDGNIIIINCEDGTRITDWASCCPFPISFSGIMNQGEVLLK